MPAQEPETRGLLRPQGRGKKPETLPLLHRARVAPGRGPCCAQLQGVRPTPPPKTPAPRPALCHFPTSPPLASSPATPATLPRFPLSPPHPRPRLPDSSLMSSPPPRGAPSRTFAGPLPELLRSPPHPLPGFPCPLPAPPPFLNLAPNARVGERPRPSG